MVAAPRGSAILDGQELGGRCGYVICEHATWCWSEGDERSGSGLVQQYYNAHSWSILDDGTDTWVPEIASNGSGDLVWCLLGRDVHQSLHCLCDHSYLQLNGSTARSRPSQSSPLRSQQHQLGQGTMDNPLSPERLHLECQVEEEVIKGVANVECGPIGDESCGGRERCWAWLYVVVCVWVCMLLDQWCKLSLQSMLWPNQGEEIDDVSDNRRVSRSQQGMQIFIKGMTGRTITLTVALDASIEAIK